ncbi:hypothetical protein O9428_17880, partial [Proteus mirabilis]|uniref:hypothetical protein n=1 Tax=Proteus mirabilis TaxID=584 RepID=UPI002577C838
MGAPQPLATAADAPGPDQSTRVVCPPFSRYDRRYRHFGTDHMKTIAATLFGPEDLRMAEHTLSALKPN